MERVIIIRFGELFLKGKNRDYFESLLIKNIKTALGEYKFEFRRSQGRYFVENYNIADEAEIVDCIKKVFGVYSVSVAAKVKTEFENGFKTIKEIAVEAAKNKSAKLSASR